MEIPPENAPQTITLLSPHGVMRVHVSVANGAQNVLVLVAPKVFLLYYEIHQMLLGEGRRFAAPVAVEDAEKGCRENVVLGQFSGTLFSGHSPHSRSLPSELLWYAILKVSSMYLLWPTLR